MRSLEMVTNLNSVSIYRMSRRVACYVTRPGSDGDELLVMSNPSTEGEGFSELEIPVADMLRFEGIEAAALRVVEALSGLSDLAYRNQLGGVELGLDEPGGPSMTTFVHLTASADGPAGWQHAGGGSWSDDEPPGLGAETGSEDGSAVTCRWEPLPLQVELAPGHAANLHRLPGVEESFPPG